MRFQDLGVRRGERIQSILFASGNQAFPQGARLRCRQFTGGQTFQQPIRNAFGRATH
jgi:hypothetical protein